MKKHLVLVTLVAVFVCSAQAGLVTQLNTENFDSLTSEGKWLVDFFAPWCPHCQQLEPIFEESAIAISKQFPGVKFGSVDCTQESDICTRMNIEGYPTLKYIRGGISTEYEGGREGPDFISWAKLVAGPPSTKLKDNSAINKFRSFTDVSFVLYSASDADLKAFHQVAEIYQDTIRFGYVKSEKLVEAGKYKVTWYNDGEPEDFTGEAGKLDSELLKHWIVARKYPHFVEFDASSWKHFASLNKPLVIAVAKKINDKKSGLLRVLSDLSKQNDQFIFGKLDDDRYAAFSANYISASDPRPTFFVMDPQQQVYWANSSIPHNKKAIEAYLDGITSGTIPSSSTAATGFYRVLNQILQVLGDVLEDPLTLGIVVALFILIVFVAVWFLSFSVSEEENLTGNPGIPIQHKSSATIETPGKLKQE